MNHNMIKQSFIARAKTLAHVMTRSSNVKVTVSGDTAYNTSGLINIPAGDFTDKEWLKMVTGWIDHELGHEKHTDDATYQSFARKGQLQRHLLNIVEDVWMERAVGREFPGAMQNLATLAELAVKRDLFQNPTGVKHPLAAVTSFLLYGGRAKIIGQHCLDDYADIALTEVEKHFGADFAVKLAAIRDDIDTVNSTTGATKIAQAVIDLLKEEKDKQQQQQQQQQQNQSGNTDDADNADSDENQSDDDSDSDDDQSGKSDDDADSDESKSGKSEDEADADSDDNQTNDSGDDADPNADSDTEQSGKADKSSKSKPTAEEILDAIQKALNEADKADIQDFHEALAEQLGKDAEEAKEESKDVADCAKALTQNTIHADASTYLSGAHMLDQVLSKRLSGGVYQTMHKVLFDQVQALETTRRVGTKLVNRRLSGIPAGNLSVFSRRVETQDVSAAISVVIDASGSMNAATNGKSAMVSANACAFAFALGLDKSGVASEFIYYGQNNGSAYTAYKAKSFTEKPSSTRFCVHPYGSTPTGPTMKFALDSLLLRPEQKKMMIVLTDGHPDDASEVKQVSALAKAFGVTIIPIGIQTSYVSGFQKDEFVTVQDPAELTSALRQAVRMKLFN